VSVPVDAHILIAETPPLSKAGSISPLARLASGHQARILNQATRKYVNGSPRCRVVAFPAHLQQELWRPETRPATYAAMYSSWASAMLGRVAATGRAPI
jgi:hypothetical protein